RLSGRLAFSKKNVTKKIHFDEGAIVFASSTLSEERLGEMLMRIGRINKDDFDKATSIMKSKRVRFGSALIEMGRISAEELKPLIIAQASDIIYSLFNWSTGRYEVRRSKQAEEPVKISLSTADIIFEGL